MFLFWWIKKICKFHFPLFITSYIFIALFYPVIYFCFMAIFPLSIKRFHLILYPFLDFSLLIFVIYVFRGVKAKVLSQSTRGVSA